MQRDQSQDADIQQTEQLEPHKEPEQNEESPNLGEQTEIGAGHRAHFFSVANALLLATSPNSPELVVPENVTRRESEALKLIFEAKTGKETEQGAATAGGRVSALERMRYLQVGLMALQNVLALARNPEFQQARSHIEEIRKRLAKMKEEINQAILDEERKKREEKVKKGSDEEKAATEDAAKKKTDITMTRT